MQTIYPILTNCPHRIGDILHTTNPEHPSVSWPGTTWERLDDRFLVGAGTSYPIGDTGGSTSHKHTTQSHLLTAAESGLRGHTHTVTSFKYLVNSGNSINVGSGNWKQYGFQTDSCGDHNAINAHSHGDTGTTTAIPPYMAVYMYRRLT